MSRRGVESPQRRETFEVGPAIGKQVVETANRLLGAGLTAEEACSLFLHAATALADRAGWQRGEFLELAEQLFDQSFDESGMDADGAITSPGGVA